jgi:hypothetical protein
VHTHDFPVHGRKIVVFAEKAGRRSKRSGDKALFRDAPGPSNIKSKGCVSGSAKKEALRILSATPGAILHVCEGRL